MQSNNLDQIIEDATIDAYDISEQISGFQVLLEDADICPFAAQLSGKSVTIIRIKVKNDRLFGIYRYGGVKHTIDLLDLKFDPKMKGYQYLAAYKKWSGET